ncbi:hypothetical protein [Photobacterium phosphoreum]|uniref:hypothetical protein n=1 Tax=Photobacterium phosphoreum TaxID=659 RepID=UPI000A96E8BF|nr:hypothetical protein [Photobacterium phosphoreum]
MAIKVLVVDDSSFFRRRMSEIINADPRLTVMPQMVKKLKMAIYYVRVWLI